MKHTVMISLVVLSHYGCCHHLLDHMLQRHEHTIQKTAPIPPTCTLPDSTTTKCAIPITSPCTPADSAAGKCEGNSKQPLDLFSLLYEAVQAETDTEPRPQTLETPVYNSTTVHPYTFPPPQSLYTIILLAIPCLVFISTAIPSLYASGSFTKGALRNTNIVVIATLMHAWLALMGSSYRLMGSPWFSTTLGMHMSIHMCMNATDLIATTQIVMPNVCVGIMQFCAAMTCFAISLSANTSIAGYNEVTFFQTHLIAILLLEFATPGIWTTAEAIADWC
jgi:hypothetical protein